MGDPGTGGQARLMEEVIEKGHCVRCGACVGLCPYFEFFDGEVVVMDRCGAETSKCLQVCPRISHPDTSSQEVPRSREAKGIGIWRRALAARSRKEDIRERAQYGGVVSTLLIYAQEKGVIRSVILADKGGTRCPSGTAVQTRGGILDCAASRYSGSASLSALNLALGRGEKDVGVVGLPCQQEAIERMGEMEPNGKALMDRIGLRIGLFCTWALDPRGLRGFLTQYGLKGTIRKFDIPPPPAEIFEVTTSEGSHRFPLHEIRPLIQKGCTLCGDLTAEFADISVGAVEGREGWNTVLVRTEKGERLWEEVVGEGWLEIEDIPQENFRHLKEASLHKKQRARDASSDLQGGDR
jgi:coenzyme F420 hydrogenase subunit beta